MIDVDLNTGDDYDPDDDFPDVTGDQDLSAFKKQVPDNLDSIVKQVVGDKQKELADTQKRQRLALRRQHQDETRNRRIQAKLDKRAATDRRIGIRSSAVSQRIQSYSIASSLGFAGYVAASLVDQFVIRPKEEADIAAEDKYNADYAAYQQALEQDQIDRRRAEEDRISGMAVDEPAIRKELIDGLPDKKPDNFGNAPSPKYRQHVDDTLKRTDLDPQERAYYERQRASFLEETRPRAATLDTDPRYDSRERTERTRDKEYLDTDEELDGVPFSSRNKVGPDLVNAARGIPDFAKVLKPRVPADFVGPPAPPTATVSFLEKAGPIGLAVAAGITASQLVNQTIDKAGESVSKISKDVFTGTPTAGLRDMAKFAQGGLDPLGVNIPLQVAVTGFEVLLSLTESIKSYAEKDKEFSPLTLATSIEGDIAKLMQSMELAAKNDPMKASFINATNRLDMVWNEFKSEMFQKLGPALIVAITALSSFIKGNIGLGSAIYTAAKYTPNALGLLINAVELLAKSLEKDPVAGKLFDQLTDFMDPNNNADLPAGAFNNKMPNMVP